MSHVYPLKLYFKYKPNFIMLAAAILVNIFTWVWILFQIRPQDALIFLHYNVLFGVDFIGEWWRVYYLPLTGLFIIVINFVIGWLLFQKDKFISIILQSVSLICQIFLLVVSALLVFLNV